MSGVFGVHAWGSFRKSRLGNGKRRATRVTQRRNTNKEDLVFNVTYN